MLIIDLVRGGGSFPLGAHTTSGMDVQGDDPSHRQL